jgi:hypothetical protein
MATKRETRKTGVLEVQEDPDTKELYLELPQKMLDRLGLKPDDEIVWVENPDGSWHIVKVTEEDKK